MGDPSPPNKIPKQINKTTGENVWYVFAFLASNAQPEIRNKKKMESERELYFCCSMHGHKKMMWGALKNQTVLYQLETCEPF